MKERTNTNREGFLRISIGFVFIYFGLLKFFPGMSPAEDLAKQTIEALTFGWVPEEVSIKLLASLEVTIGLMIILNRFLKTILMVAIGHLLLTFMPFFLFPEDTMNGPSPTLLGQYIVKNVIIICAVISIFPGKLPLLSKEKAS